MATIIKRGSRTAPKFFIKFNAGVTADGKRVQRMKLLPGVRDMPAARQQAAVVEREIAAGRDPFPGPGIVPDSVGTLIDRWAAGLGNRNASNDRAMVKNHLRARFARMLVDQITLPVLMEWIDELAASDLSAQTQRHALSTLSRFFSWAIERGHASINPVKMVPSSKRPVRASTDESACRAGRPIFTKRVLRGGLTRPRHTSRSIHGKISRGGMYGQATPRWSGQSLLNTLSNNSTRHLRSSFGSCARTE